MVRLTFDTEMSFKSIRSATAARTCGRAPISAMPQRPIGPQLPGFPAQQIQELAVHTSRLPIRAGCHAVGAR